MLFVLTLVGANVLETEEEEEEEEGENFPKVGGKDRGGTSRNFFPLRRKFWGKFFIWPRTIKKFCAVWLITIPFCLPKGH